MTQRTFPGQPRKTLASQLDRLEGILDNLHDSLQTAVAAAVQQALGQAIPEAVPVLLTALLNHPQFLNALHTYAATAAPPAAAIGVAVRHACQRLGHVSGTVWRQVSLGWVFGLGLVQHSPLLVAAAKRLCAWRRGLAWASGMGLATAVVIGWAGPWLGMTVGFLSGFLLTVVVQDWQHLRPALTTWIARQSVCRCLSLERQTADQPLRSPPSSDSSNL